MIIAPCVRCGNTEQLHTIARLRIMSSAQGIMRRSRLGGPSERRALRRGVGSAAPRTSGRIDSVQVGATSGQEESSLEDELQKNKQVRSGVYADDPSLSEKPAYKGAGEAECKNCGFLYTPQKGDISYPVSKGTQFPVRPSSHLHSVTLCSTINDT